MSVAREGDTIRLVGELALEEAEPLAALLLAKPGATVDWSKAGRLHAAVAQVLLAFKPTMRGEPADPFAARWLAPLLRRPGA